jgi:hypothetical protein
VTIDAGTVTWLVIGALLLGALAVVIDRVNFPQKPFRPKRIEPGEAGAARDRTGAHIVDVSEDDWNRLEEQKRRQLPGWLSGTANTAGTDPDQPGHGKES